MIPYVVFFGLVAAMALKMRQNLSLALFLLVIFMVGLRHEVGGDWRQYIDIFESYAGESMTSLLSGSEPGYAVVNGLANQLGWGLYGANFLCAFIFTYGLWQFCKAQPLPVLALAVAIPYLVIVVAMGYTRQGVAIGLGMLALLSLERQQWFRFIGLVLLAASFHKTAVVLLGLALALSGGGWWWRIPLMSVVGYFAYQSILAESLDKYLLNYEQAGYQSQGAAIRVVMNALPAMLFLYWHKTLQLTDTQRRLWQLISYISLVMVVALLIATSSTAVDRIALYLIPLQLFVWSRLPLRYGRLSRRWVQYVVFYSFAVLMVWLVFAGHAFAWIPYQFYPFVLLFS